MVQRISKLIHKEQNNMENKMNPFRAVIKKSLLYLIPLLFLVVPILGEEKKQEQAKILFVIGNVKIIDNGESIDLKKKKEVPISSQLISEENGKLEFEYEKATYIVYGKQNLRLRDITWKYLFKASGPTIAGGVRGFQESWNSLLKESEVAFDSYIKGKEVQDYAGLKVVLDRSFAKLIDASGTEKFTPRYAIINDESFNAMALAGGQFIVHIGALKTIDAKVAEELKIRKGETKDFLRENYISAILSHELAHYLNKHIFNARKRIYGQSKEEKKDNLYVINELKYSQEIELDADNTGLLLLQKAGYDTIWMVKMLELLNDLAQKAGGEISPYFSSHPSGHMRLAKIPNKEQELHQWMSKMEYVYADIQFGRNLEASLAAVEDALKKYPNNKAFLKAIAVCKHKMWLETVTLEDQMLRSIIDQPSFRDNMILADGATRRAGREIPGDKMKYYDAKKAYELALGRFPDAYFISNYAMMLVYSDEAETVKNGVFLAEIAYSLKTCIQTENNLGVAYFISETNKEEAFLLLTGLARRVDTIHFALPEIKGQATSIQGISQSLDKSYIAQDFTPTLNLALVSVYLKKTEIAKDISTRYLKNIDSSSKWAILLSEFSQVKIPKKELSDTKISLEKINLGSPQSKLKETIFKTEKPVVAPYEDDSKKGEILNYRKAGAAFIIESEKIIRMHLYKEGLSLSNGISIGMAFPDAEKVLQTKSNRSGEYYVYSGKENNLALRVLRDKVVEIIVFE